MGEMRGVGRRRVWGFGGGGGCGREERENGAWGSGDEIDGSGEIGRERRVI